VDPAGLSFLPPGVSVGPSAEDRIASAAAQQAAAATVQANLASAAYELNLPSPAEPKNLKNPELDHPLFAALRFVASGVGAHKCPADPDAVSSSGFMVTMAGRLRDPWRAEEEYSFGHVVTVGMLVNTARGAYGSVILEEFTKRDKKFFLTTSPVFDSPMKFAPAPPVATDPEVIYDCGRRLARWLSFMVHLLVGEAFEELVEAAYACYEDDPSFTATDLRGVYVEGLRRFELQNRQEFARLESKARQLGKSLLGSGSQSQQVMRDIGLTANKDTGCSFLKAPWGVLRTETPGEFGRSTSLGTSSGSAWRPWSWPRSE